MSDVVVVVVVVALTHCLNRGRGRRTGSSTSPECFELTMVVVDCEDMPTIALILQYLHHHKLTMVLAHVVIAGETTRTCIVCVWGMAC